MMRWATVPPEEIANEEAQTCTHTTALAVTHQTLSGRPEQAEWHNRNWEYGPPMTTARIWPNSTLHRLTVRRQASIEDWPSQVGDASSSVSRSHAQRNVASMFGVAWALRDRGRARDATRS